MQNRISAPTKTAPTTSGTPRQMRAAGREGESGHDRAGPEGQVHVGDLGGAAVIMSRTTSGQHGMNGPT